jgi:hypothetical protein
MSDDKKAWTDEELADITFDEIFAKVAETHGTVYVVEVDED